MDIEQYTANWNFPTAIRAGAGRIKDLPAACIELGMKKPLIITDPGLSQLPMIQEARLLVSSALDGCGLFSGIKGNPTGENVS
ncbi:iron-containing alcohol dehydrogenase, partial [Endozoicomonas sp. SESOKO3]